MTMASDMRDEVLDNWDSVEWVKDFVEKRSTLQVTVVIRELARQVKDLDRMLAQADAALANVVMGTNHVSLFSGDI